MNTCAAVIAGTWVAHLYVWRKESINMFLILSEENNQQKFYLNEDVKSQCVSAIGLHLMQNPECAIEYINDQFFILAKARSMFHLSILETTQIKISKPILRRQKEFCLFTSNFSLAAMQLVSNGNVVPLVGASTTFEIQPISIHYFSLRIRIF